MFCCYHTKNLAPIYPYIISEGRQKISTCDRHSDKIATLEKNVTEYKHVRKWIVEFPS